VFLTKCYTGDQIEKNVMGGHVACAMEKPEGKRPLGRTIHRREDNINADGAWIGLIWLRTEKGGGLL
jgi:hypothetical protein